MCEVTVLCFSCISQRKKNSELAETGKVFIYYSQCYSFLLPSFSTVELHIYLAHSLCLSFAHFQI